MQQLGALDNLMIDGELPNLPMHMSALMIYDTGGKRGSARLFDTFQDRFHRIIEEHFPILRCRLEQVALHMDKAYWVEDPNFAMTYHVNRVALPKGQGWPELYRLFGQFHAQPLDSSRPLWEAMYVEGLDKVEGIPRGAAAMFVKIHHAVMDGKGALNLLSSFHNLSLEPGAPIVADSTSRDDADHSDFSSPSLLAKYGRAWWHSIERPVDLAATLLKFLPELFKSGKSTHTSLTQATPHSRFNHAIAPDRVVGHVRMDMAELRRLEKKHHCTINDIALCVVAGALRDYLLDHEDLPAEDLITLMPISVRRPEEESSIGNHVSVAKISLRTTIDDPKKRLHAIHKDTSHGKKQGRKGSSLAMMNLVDDVHPAVILWLGQWLISSGHIDDFPPAVNTVVTNVPGIPGEAYIGDKKLLDYLGFGPLAPNTGLFHTVSSTPEQVNISFLSTEELLGDGEAYRLSMTRSWEEVSQL